MKLKFAVVYEQTPNNYSAYPPDLPGCIVTDRSWRNIRDVIREAITFHIESMLEDGEPLPDRLMSVEDAMAYHCRTLTDAKEMSTKFDDVPTLSTTFEMVEVEVALDPAGAVV